MKDPPQRGRNKANVSPQKVTYSKDSITGPWMLPQLSHGSLIWAEDGVRQFFKLNLIFSVKSPEISLQTPPPSTHCCSVTQLCLTLQPHGPQHTRTPCPSPSPEVCPSSCPLHWWCHPAISSSDTLFSSLPSTHITHITHSQIRLVLGFPDFTCSQPWLHIRKTQRVCLFV